MDTLLILATFLGGWVTLMCLLLTLLMRKYRRVTVTRPFYRRESPR